MRIVRYEQDYIGIVVGEGIHDISDKIDTRWRHTPYAVNDLITRWGSIRSEIGHILTSPPSHDLSSVRILSPTPCPKHIFSAPLNYATHIDEMLDSSHATAALAPQDSADVLGFFLKATGSISGPHEPIQLPVLPGRVFHHEIELGVVIGRETRGIQTANAHTSIFGYVCLLDITMRTDSSHQEERAMRKSFQTFTPTGPFIVTADEIVDEGRLNLHLEVNGEPRQSANTADMIVSVPELVARASHVLTLEPGDVYATGTPAGVGPIVPGDTITAGVESVGELRIAVAKRSW